MKRTGTPGVVEGAPRLIRDDRGVVTTEREWTGYRSELSDFANTLSTPYRIEQLTGPVYKLTTSTNGNLFSGLPSPSPESQVVTVWDLDVQQQRRDLWELPVVANEIRRIVDLSERTGFLKMCKEFSQGETVHYTYDDAGSIKSAQLTYGAIIDAATLRGLNLTVIKAFLDDLSQGVDSYLHNTFVLSKKRVGPAQATNLVTEFTLVNRAVSNGTLLAQESSIPAAIRAPMASQLSAGAWIRQSDKLNQLDAGRIEVNTQWVWAPKWSILIFGTAL